MSDPERLAFERWLNNGHHCGANENMWKAWLARSLLDASAPATDARPVAIYQRQGWDGAWIDTDVIGFHSWTGRTRIVYATRDAAPSDAIKAYERHDPDSATEPFLAFIPSAKIDTLIGALLDDLKKSDRLETDFYLVRWFIGGLGLLAAAHTPTEKT